MAPSTVSFLLVRYFCFFSFGSGPSCPPLHLFSFSGSTLSVSRAAIYIYATWLYALRQSSCARWHGSCCCPRVGTVSAARWHVIAGRPANLDGAFGVDLIFRGPAWARGLSRDARACEGGTRPRGPGWMTGESCARFGFHR